MASVELATAYVSLIPSMKGAQGKIAQELGAVDADGIGKDIGGRMGGGIAGTMKSLVGPALAALAAVGFGDMVKEAAAASDATDKFKSTMNFAGIDTSGIQAATKAAKDYADQTVYDLPTIQATMAQLASNGVTNYTELTQAAGNLNAVAGGNAETFKSVSRTLTQSAGAGKLMTEDWNMLADAIPGASGPLQKVMKEAGAFQGNFKDAMAAGEISSQEFQDALSKLGNDPIAVEAARSVTTFEGALGNLSATVNSGLMGALDALKPAITGAINGLSAGLGAVFGWFGNLFSGLQSLIMDGDITPNLLKALGVEEDSPVIAGLMWVQGRIWAVFRGIQDFIAGFTIPIPDMAAQIAGGLGPLASFGATVRLKVEEGLNGVRDFVTGFTIPMPDLLSAGFDMGPMARLGSAVRDIFESLKAVLAPVVPDFVALWQAISPVNTIFQALLPSLSPILAILGNLVEVVGFGLLDAISGVLPVFQSLQATMIVLFTDVLSTALPLIAQLVQMLGATLAELIPVLVPIVVQVVNLAAALISQLAPIFMSLVSSVLPVVVESLGLILGAIAPLVQMIGGILVPTIQFLMPIVVTVFGVIANVIQAAMQIVLGIIQTVTGIISGDWAQVWEGLGNVFGGIWNTIVAAVGGAFQVIGSVILSGLSMLAGFFAPGLAAIGQFFADAWNGMVSFLSGVWNTIAGVVAAGVAMLVAPIVAGLTTAWNFVVSIFTAVGNFISGVWNWIVSLVTNILIAFWQTHGAQLTAIWNVVVSIFNAIAGFIGGIWNSIVNTVGGYLGYLWGITVSNLTAVWNFISSIFTTVFGFLSGIWNGIVGVVGGAVSSVYGVIASGFGAAWGFISSVFGQVAGFLGGIWNNIVSGVSGMIGNVVNALGGLGGKIMGALAGAGSWLYDIGRNIVEGLMNGIKSLAGTIGNFFLSLIPGWIVGPFKAALGIASPSKVFRGFGRNIGEGVVLGIGDMRADLESATSGMVTVPSSPAYGSATAAGDYRTTGGFGSTFNIYETDDPIATAHAVTRRQTALAV